MPSAGNSISRTIRAAISAPAWILALVTGAKSFVDNPIIGSPMLNRFGLHVLRIKAAHGLAGFRRRRLRHLIPEDLREQFDQNGFVLVPEGMVPEDFAALKATLLEAELESRSHQQGDSITRRVPIGPDVRHRFPQLNALLESRRWKGVMAYVASTRSEPIYYIQTIFGGAVEGPPDPQLQLHADTFHPSLKAWLFLTDVEENGRPLTYVAGSHRLTEKRVEWERKKSLEVLSDGDRLSQRGSFRVAEEELAALDLPAPTHFVVPANTLVVADTCGFHARANSSVPTVRVELFAYCRRTPFLPWTGFDLLSWRPLAQRRAEWANAIVDWLDRRGLMKQHWRPIGPRRVAEPDA